MKINKPLRHTIAAAALALTGLTFTSAVLAQESDVQKNFEAYKASSKTLMGLLSKPVTDAAAAAALEKQIDEEMKKRQAAGDAMQTALQKLDPKNQQHVKLAEQVYSESQKSNQEIGEQHVKASEAIAKAKQPAKK
ncbi:MAG: hypothetical protein HYS18_08485 [Burkholderiales bacterium]|nr:hypothetical protein [Burkholderiales bacterium]